MRKADIIYTCDVCGKSRKGNCNGVTCRFCNKFMLSSCECYGNLGIPRKCCIKGKEHDEK